MGFIKKIWKDRISEFPTRRSLTKTDGTSEIVTVSRSEGMISQEGDAFSAENMNDFENRVANGFRELNEKMQNISFGFSASNSIKTISSRTDTYIAEQDCWCVGRIKGSSSYPCGINLDTVQLFNLDAVTFVPVVFPVKKGQNVSITGAETICSLKFFI